MASADAASAAVKLLRRSCEVTRVAGYLIGCQLRLPSSKSRHPLSLLGQVLLLAAAATRYVFLWVNGSSLFRGAHVALTEAIEEYEAWSKSSTAQSFPVVSVAWLTLTVNLLIYSKRAHDAAVGLALVPRLASTALVSAWRALRGGDPPLTQGEAATGEPPATADPKVAEDGKPGLGDWISLLLLGGLAVCNTWLYQRPPATAVAAVHRLAEPLHLSAIGLETASLRRADDASARAHRWFVVLQLVAYCTWIGALLIDNGWWLGQDAPDLSAAWALLRTNRLACWAVLRAAVVLAGASRLLQLRHTWAFLVLALVLVASIVVLPQAAARFERWLEPRADQYGRILGNTELICLLFLGFSGGAQSVVVFAVFVHALVTIQGIGPGLK